MCDTGRRDPRWGARDRPVATPAHTRRRRRQRPDPETLDRGAAARPERHRTPPISSVFLMSNRWSRPLRHEDAVLGLVLLAIAIPAAIALPMVWLGDLDLKS